MTQYTSEEALNGIFNILNQMVEERNTNQSQNDTGDLISQLMLGISAGAEAGVSVGDQVQSLAQGMAVLKQEGITEMDGENVATIIREIGTAINDISIGEVNQDGIIGIATALRILGTIDEALIDNINNLSKIDIEIADNILTFISKLDFRNIGALQDDNIGDSIRNLSYLMNSISGILDSSKISTFNIFAPMRGYLIGKSIAVFFEQIVEAVPEKKIKLELKGVADLIKALDPLLSDTSMFSVFHMKRKLSPANGKFIGQFFNELLRTLPNEKESGEALQGIANVIHALFNEKVIKNFKRGLKIYNKENAQGVAQFVTQIIKGASKGTEETAKNLQAVSGFIKELSSIGILNAASLKLVLGIMNEDTGKSVAKFIKEIAKVMTDKNKDALKSFTASVKDLSMGMLYVTGSIALVTATIALFGITTVLEAVAVTLAATTGIMLLMNYIAQNDKDIKEATQGLKNIALAVTLLVANVAVIAFIADYAGQIEWESLGKVAVIMGSLLLVTYIASKMADVWARRGKDMIYAMTGIAALLIGGALAVNMLVETAAENSWIDLALGIGMITGVILLGVWMMNVLEKHNKDVKNALFSMTVLTGLLLVTGLIIREILIPIGEEAGAAALGVVVVAGLMFAMAGIVHMLNKISDPKKVLLATASVAAMSFLMIGIALITKEILIPLGEQQDKAFTGAITAIAITSAFGVLTWVAGKMFNDKDKLLNATLAMVAVSGIMLVLSESVSHFVSLADKLSGTSIEYILGAGALMAALVGSIGGIAFAIGQMLDKNEKYLLTLGKGALVLTGIGAIIAILSNCMGEYIEFTKEISQVSAGDLLAAGTTMVLVLGVFGALMAGIGTLVSSGVGGAILIAGAASMIGIAGVIDITSMIVTDYVKRAVELAKYNYADINDGNMIMTETLTSFGIIMGMTGLFAPLLAVGGLVMLEMGEVMGNVIKNINAYSEGILGVLAMNRTNKWETGDLYSGSQIVKGVFDSFYELMDSLGFGVLKQAGYLAVYRTAMDASLDVIMKYADILVYTKKNMTQDDVINFHKMMIGEQGLDDKTSMLGSINTLVNGLMDIGDMIDTGLFFIMGMKASKTVLDVISKFIDVVAKAASLTYVMGYDANGNPMYGRIQPEDFDKAAAVVTDQFKSFVINMTQGMSDVSILGLVLCSYMDKAMLPVVDVIGKYVDVVSKVATMTFVTGYDENGKPVYMKISAQQFKSAGDSVADSFMHFVTQLTERSKELKLRTVRTIGYMGDSMGPIMDSISSFVDAIMKAATGTYVMGYDEQGRAQYQRVTSVMMESSAEKIVDNFITFIDSLDKEVSGMKKRTAKTIGLLGEGLGAIMEGVSGFVDGIMKAATGTYVLSYDENGKPKEIIRVTDEDFNNAADKIVTQFGKFIDKLIQQTKDLKKKKAEVIGEFGESIGEVMDSVSSFTDAIMKVATGSYIKGYTEDGKAIYEHVSDAMIDRAADTVITYYMYFINKLTEYASDPKLKKGVLDYMDTIGETINPIMDSVVDFADMLTKFLKPNGTIKKNGQEIPFYLDLNKIGEASEKIASAYIIFIDTLVTKLDGKTDFGLAVEKASEYMQTASQVVKQSASGAASLAELLKTLEQTKGLSDIAAGKPGNLAIMFVDALTNFAGAFIAADVNFELAHQKMDDARRFLTVAKEAGALFSDLMNSLSGANGLSNYSKIVSNYTGAIKMLSSAEGPDKMYTENLLPFLQQTLTAASHLQQIEHIMGTGDVSKAVNKFIKDINMLASKEISGKLETSKTSMGLFSVEMQNMTTVITQTNLEMSKFAASVERASTALQDFDKAVLAQEKKRNDALREFGAIVKDIATSMETLSSKIESLDKNKILENFRGIVDLLKVSDADSNPKTGGARTAAQSVPVVAPQKIFENSIIEFKFDNVHFTGIANQI